jgi:putative ABC transport system permease protein
MHRIAIRSLLHHRDKAAAALAGVTFAAMMVFVQGGVYIGFLDAAAGLVTRMGGDLWVAPKGTQAVDLSETMTPDVGLWVRAQPCVRRARPLYVGFIPYRTVVSHASNSALVIAGEGPDDEHLVPWNTVRGLPQDLRGPLRITIDESDRKRLETGEHAIGDPLELRGVTAHVAAVTRGIRSFTTAPVVFANLAEVQQLMNLPVDAARFWVVDLHHPGCASDVARRIEAHSELQALDTAAFRRQSEKQWIGNSGAGALLAFSAFLGFLVGAVVVAQTLFHITSDHLRELGTLKALGATDRELVSFVAWQAALLATLGSLLGWCIAKGLSLSSHTLAIRLSAPVVVVGIGVISLMCALACLTSLRKVLMLDPAEVLR